MTTMIGNSSLPREAEFSGEFCRSLAGNISAAGANEQLGMQLAREMRRSWHSGECVAAEKFLDERPELWHRPEAAVDLIYEEFCLRQAGGQSDVEQDLLRRFPQWAAPLRVMLDCHRVLQSDRDLPQFPAPGDTVGDFRLLAELGRGASGRVFLTTQTALADRPVVLKITPLDGVEHLSLARLQHTNIVPLYSVLDDTERNIRALCMPYFGRATLGSLLKSLANVPLAARTGRHVVDAIDESKDSSASPSPVASAARQMLAHVSYVQAMCWLTACLADALEFAHERNLVHLDLKPSNVLLATDGQPMLLDFHLAREPIRPGGPLPDKFGGTPDYMPPEQQAAMQSLERFQPVETAVDGRADLYSLGAMLYESLGGRLPIAADSPPLSQINSHASVGLSEIVAKCVANRPADRYSSTAALADDLRRHLHDQPLVGVPNRSLAERWHKWRRRRPNTLRTAGMFAVIATAAALLISGMWSQMRDRRQQAERALSDGQAQLQNPVQVEEAVQSFQHGLALAEILPFEHALQQQLREQLGTARRLHLAKQLHGLADEIRVLYGIDTIPADRLLAVAAHCRAFWDQRAIITQALSSTTGFDVSADLQDVAIFWAGLQVKPAADSESTAARREALRILDETEAMFGPSAVLERERQIHREALGIPGATENSSERSAPAAPRTAWEHYALGRASFASGNLSQAADELSAARALDPAGCWPNFYYGLCAYRMRRYEDAVVAFSVCIGTSPHVAGCYYNRALAYAALGRPDRATDDYTYAIELDPTLAAAWLNRAMLHYEIRRNAEAAADLRQALEHGADPATVYYDLALVHLATNDHAAADRDLQHALEFNPNHEQARRLRDTMERKGTESKTGR